VSKRVKKDKATPQIFYRKKESYTS